jgi:predicted MFS family arabinose efflux permease
MVGPAVAVVLSTTLPQGVALYLVGAGVVGTAALLWWLNSPMQPEGGHIPQQAPSRRSWLKPRLVALMVVAVAATFVLSATEITVVATLDDAGLKHWTGLTIALWCLYSLVGGLVFGAGKWRASAVGLVAAMAALTIPIGLGSAWPWLLLALLPSGLLCAPTMTATNDHLAKIVPPAAQGEANGVLGSAFTLGISMGAPFAGLVIDQWGTSWAFAAVGTLGLLAALAAVPVSRLAPRASVDGTDGPAPAADPVPETAAA